MFHRQPARAGRCCFLRANQLLTMTEPTPPTEGQLPTNTAPIVPGQRTTEAAAGGIVGIAALLPILQGVFGKQADTTVEVICISVVACVYIISRTWLKGRA